uniref:DNA-directed RNA polymerase II subunit RPB1 n=1 Tax=viral metagenome TaxID=1070528 RepID=A0A6C0LVD1_9ZZZZ
MPNNTNLRANKQSAKIIGIQFSILSPEEIRRASVAEITSRETYDNNKPKIGGLFDPRMGVLEPGLICPTDGLDYTQTPGYFGHIELAKPVFYIQYLNTLLKILRSVCFKCSRLLVDKEKYKQALKLEYEERWNYVYQIANKAKKCCGCENDIGCGYKQPSKFRKEGLANIYAEWDSNEGMTAEELENLSIRISPEIALKILRRVSDEDVTFMGFNPLWSRPDWMICQVLAVPPPAVRPSVKHDAQQRSEDDITHTIVNIIKTNKILEEKMKQTPMAPDNVIDDWSTMLQYYIATQVDNKIPGVAAVAQRSGRPLKSIKERLNGKTGRVRGNLMGKRVDYSARSVITADPNISIRELGVPLKVAKNITKPVVVNNRNKAFLMTLIENGADNWPGAKIIEKSNGQCTSLRYAKNIVQIENGDIVHRHMMDGDNILFNRQPTLHRMSMMSHRVKVMQRGDTFRMNVADTKPYNADFDGDEMNLHMPQDMESESELINMAAVHHQLVSPANNATIVGIFQDSLLGAFRFTREGTSFTPRQAMNLLMNYDNVNPALLQDKTSISYQDILTQIMPPVTLIHKSKLFKEGEDAEISNNVLDIRNGSYKRGKLEKGLLGSGTKGILHRVTNDFGNVRAAKFIDDLQNIITDYMNTSSFSVGISDLISNQETNQSIVDIISQKKREVKDLLDTIHLGVFENNTGKPDIEEFETQVNAILSVATKEAGNIGLKNLDPNNRFVQMVNAGSKGSDLNISQMISCLGQQNVNGKRIPYGFDNRTLPHFSKYDDSMAARGFVESSYISGLRPEELFFHAMGGRVGLIDTAVKTSQTGYIQRRLIKGMEDLKVEYDMTVRNNKNKIVQFSYGDDGMDTVRVEGQILPITTMSMEDMYTHFHVYDENDNKTFSKPFTPQANARVKKQKADLIVMCEKYVKQFIEVQDKIVNNIFKKSTDNKVYHSVSFQHIIQNIQHQCNLSGNSLVDITPLECFQKLERTMETLKNIHFCPPNELFKTLFFYYLSPKQIICVKRFNAGALQILLDTIVMTYKKSIVAPGEMVGMIAAQSIGEPTTQMTLNTFHFAGVASKSNVTRGVPRIEEILSLSENPKNPALTISLKDEDELERSKAQSIMYNIEHTKLGDVVSSVQICFDPNDSKTLIGEDDNLMTKYMYYESIVDECSGTSSEGAVKDKSKWVIRIKMNREILLEKNITMDDIHYALTTIYKEEISCVFNDYNDDNLVFRIRMKKPKKGKNDPTLDQSDEIYILKNFQDNLLNNIVLRGVKNIKKVVLRKVTEVKKQEDKYEQVEKWVLDTIGNNLLDALALDYIDPTRTTSNNIIETYNVLGIEAARQTIYDELVEVIEFDGTYINAHHLNILCDRMSYNTKMTSIFRHGINNDNIGPIAKASFEETPEMFLKAARHGELDIMRGVSANVMCGQEGNFGTGAFQVVVDIEQMQTLEPVEHEVLGNLADIMEENKNIDKSEFCSTDQIQITNNMKHLTKVVQDDDDGYMPNF